MSNTQLLINQLQDVSTRGSLSTAYKSYCILLISEFRYYQRNYEPLQYRQEVYFIRHQVKQSWLSDWITVFSMLSEVLAGPCTCKWHALIHWQYPNSTGHPIPCAHIMHTHMSYGMDNPDEVMHFRWLAVVHTYKHTHMRTTVLHHCTCIPCKLIA